VISPKLAPEYNSAVSSRRSALESWSPEQIATGRRWAATWRDAVPYLEAIRRRELRALDTFAAIALLRGPADYREGSRAPKPTSGLVDQQRLFSKLRRP
jgi:hypothetical protein